jgi:hypothetical protein
MLKSRVDFFRSGAAECHAAAQAAKDPAIKQAYLELARGWGLLVDEIERLISRQWRSRTYSGHALPRRRLDDFYELRSASGGERSTKTAIEHPMLGDRRETAAAGCENAAAAHLGSS